LFFFSISEIKQDVDVFIALQAFAVKQHYFHLSGLKRLYPFRVEGMLNNGCELIHIFPGNPQ
jgi:hypothetical protein